MKKSILISAALILVTAVILSAGCIQVTNPAPAPTPTPVVITETVYVETTPDEYGAPQLSASYLRSDYNSDIDTEYADFEVYNGGAKTAERVTLYVYAKYSDSVTDTTGEVYVGTVGPNQAVTVTVPLYYSNHRDYLDDHYFETNFDHSFAL